MLPAGPHVRGVAGRPCDIYFWRQLMAGALLGSVRVMVHEPLRLAMAKERLRFFDTKTELAI